MIVRGVSVEEKLDIGKVFLVEVFFCLSRCCWDTEPNFSAVETYRGFSFLFESNKRSGTG